MQGLLLPARTNGISTGRTEEVVSGAQKRVLWGTVKFVTVTNQAFLPLAPLTFITTHSLFLVLLSSSSIQVRRFKSTHAGRRVLMEMQRERTVRQEFLKTVNCDRYFCIQSLL